MLLPCRPSCVGGNDAYTKILLHFDGDNASTTITDYCAGASPHAWTNNTGSIATAQYKFGGSSYNCGAAAGWVTTGDSADFTVGSGAFTVDLWIRPGSTGVQKFICGQCDSSNTASTRSVDLQVNASNKIVFMTWVSGSSTLVTSTTSITSATWMHIAAIRTGNTLRLFINGTQEGGDVIQAGTLNDSGQNFSVGRLGAFNTNKFNGYIDEFRFSVGIARWTAGFPLNNTSYG